MIRWRYIGIRLVVVLLVLMLLRWSANPVAQYFIVKALQGSAGAKVEVASTDLGLFPPRLLVHGLTIGDARKDMRNLFEAESVELMIDGSALLRRRFEIANSQVSGLRVGTHRTTSGALEVVPSEDEEDESAGPSMISQWSAQLAGDAEENAKAFADSLATVTESKRIRDFWESEYATLRRQATALEDNVRALKSTARSIDNPLRDLPALQETLRRAEEIKRDLIAVRQRLDTMPTQIRGDMNALEDAKRQDQARVRGYLPENLPDDKLMIGPELLASLVRDQLQQVREYLDSGRSIADVTVSGPTIERARGETLAVGGPAGPAWLVRRCEVSGFLTANSDEYEMLGVVENITSDHVNRDGPLHARLRLTGPRVVRIDYQRFYDTSPFPTQSPKDHLKIHWPQLPLPAKKFGDGQDAALVIDGGKMELWVEIEAQDDQISGHLISRQTDTRLALDTKPKLQDTILAQSLNRSLADINAVDVDARFSGTWKKMDLDISTSLSDQLAGGMRMAINESVAATRQRLAEEVDEQYSRQSRELEQWLGEQQADARKLIAKADEAVDTMSKKVVAELGAPDAYIGRLRGGLKGLLK